MRQPSSGLRPPSPKGRGFVSILVILLGLLKHFAKNIAPTRSVADNLGSNLLLRTFGWHDPGVGNQQHELAWTLLSPLSAAGSG